MTENKTVIATGAFGNVGGNLIKELCLQNYNVIAFDIKTKKTEKKYKTLSDEFKFETVWGDLTNEDQVKKIVKEYNPDVVIHVAAVIAPTAYLIPEIAYDVNVNGTKYLIEASKELEGFDKFIFVSSYSIHGPRNPYTVTDRLRGDTPVNAKDSYGKHKVKCEDMLENSELPWTIIRLPAVFSIDEDFGSTPEFMKFSFILPPDRNEHGIDARDAGLALANAIEADTISRKFTIGGPEDWKGKAFELQNAIMNARGLGKIGKEYYLRADPDIDESWYYEDFVDTTESQKVLNYQRYSFEEYLEYIKNQAGFMRYIMRLTSPLIKRMLYKSSITGGEEVINSRPIWEVVKEEFEINEEDLVL